MMRRLAVVVQLNPINDITGVWANDQMFRPKTTDLWKRNGISAVALNFLSNHFLSMEEAGAKGLAAPFPCTPNPRSNHSSASLRS